MSIAIIILLLIVIGYGFYLYNKLIRYRHLVREAWSAIDVFLKKRHDLVPAIVEVVKAYAAHEKTTLKELTENRTQAEQATQLKVKEQAEGDLQKSLDRLFVVVENYPELKADRQFLNLQQELTRIEDDLEKARRYYNGTVRQKNTLVESVPSNIVANLFGFKKSPFFQLTNPEEGKVAPVNF